MRNADHGVRVPTTGKPEFAMYGIRRPDGSCRVHASRDLLDAHFGQREDGYDVATHIDATMREVLTVDAPTWGEAFAKLFELWENRDRAKALDRAAEMKLADGHHPEPPSEEDLRRGRRELLEYTDKHGGYMSPAARRELEAARAADKIEGPL